jgi:hypothetical protein
MDILTLFLLFVAATAVGGILYITVWIVQAVRRVGVRRFGGALVDLVKALLATLLKLFTRERNPVESSTHDDYHLIDAIDDIRIARETQQRSQTGAHAGNDSSY